MVLHNTDLSITDIIYALFLYGKYFEIQDILLQFNN